jgi:hypothetical protein
MEFSCEYLPLLLLTISTQLTFLLKSKQTSSRCGDALSVFEMFSNVLDYGPWSRVNTNKWKESHAISQ